MSTYGNTDVINAVGSVHAQNDVIKARATEQEKNHPPPIPHSDDRGLNSYNSDDDGRGVVVCRGMQDCLACTCLCSMHVYTSVYPVK